MKHKDNRDPEELEGLQVLRSRSTSSHQAMLLRYYLAEHGLDPDRDVQFRVVPPSEYVSNLRTGNVDGFFGGEPGGQRAVYEGAGFLHLLSRDIWLGPPVLRLLRGARSLDQGRTQTPSSRSIVRWWRRACTSPNPKNRGEYLKGAGAGEIISTRPWR